MELTSPVDGNVVVINSRCVSGQFNGVVLKPRADDCRAYTVTGQTRDPATGSLTLLLKVDKSGCGSNLARVRSISPDCSVATLTLFHRSAVLLLAPWSAVCFSSPAWCCCSSSSATSCTGASSTRSSTSARTQPLSISEHMSTQLSTLSTLYKTTIIITINYNAGGRRRAIESRTSACIQPTSSHAIHSTP